MYGQPTPHQKDVLQETLQLGLDFLSGEARGGKVIDYRSEQALREAMACDLPRAGTPMPALLAELRETVVRFSVAQGDARYLAFPDAGNSLASLSADILSAFTNQNLIAFDRSAPSGTVVEMQLIHWLRELIGFSHCCIDADGLTLSDMGGMWTSGGNMSNHVAVLTALNARFPSVKQTGLRGLDKKPVMILARGIEHFSFSSAALSLGLGQDSLVWTPARSDFTTDTKALDETLANLPDHCEPFMVVSVAGNCRTTGIDDILGMRDVCDRHGLWLHIDACHGGNLLFSKQMRHRLHGIAMAESVSLDPHKGLFVGYPCSYVLFRDSTALQYICRYPDKFHDPDCLDLGLIMPFYGSRGFHSLKLWLLMRHLGVDGLGELIEQRQKLNDRLVGRLRDTGEFALLNDGSYYRTAFVFFPHEVAQMVRKQRLDRTETDAVFALVNRYTSQLSEKIYQAGNVVFDLFTLADMDDRVGLGASRKYTAMAMAVGHPDMPADIEDAIFDEIARHARPLGAQFLDNLSGLKTKTDSPALDLHSKGPAGW